MDNIFCPFSCYRKLSEGLPMRLKTAVRFRATSKCFIQLFWAPPNFHLCFSLWFLPLLKTLQEEGREWSLLFTSINKMQIVFPCATILLLPVLVLIQGYKRLEFQPALGQVALKFCLPWASARFLINDLFRRQLGDPLHIQQVEMRSYPPIEKTYNSLPTCR